MKKHKYIIGIIILSSVLFCFCQKKWFKHVECHGRVMTLMTNQPKKALVTLLSDDVNGNGLVVLSTTTCNDDGTFHIKTPASKGKDYYLSVNYNNDWYRRKIFLREYEDTNLETPIGSYTFYCKVTLVPVSSSAIDFWTWNGPLHFNAGTSTQFITNLTMSAAAYVLNEHKTYLTYETYPGGVATYSNVAIPLNSPDTLNLTVNY